MHLTLITKSFGGKFFFRTNKAKQLEINEGNAFIKSQKLGLNMLTKDC